MTAAVLTPIMQPDQETMEKWIEAYNSAPLAYIKMKGFQVPSLEGSCSLLDHLDYTPAERHQGNCGNCWAWAGTGCMGIALDVQEGVKDRLSVQYINSCESVKIGKPCCEGGFLHEFADFYHATNMAIPWDNINAHWQDGDGSCDTLCSTISTTPNYPISSIDDVTIPTQTVDQAAAISNIKNILDQNKAVWFAFYLPDNSAWSDFEAFWNNNGETVVYDMDQFCGIPYNVVTGGGHAVLCVGYNDEAGTVNDYWVMLNSWGTAGGNRPNGLFRIDMDMAYNGRNEPYYSFYWETLDVTFGTPDISVSPTSFEKFLPPNNTQDYTLTINNDGDAELTYSITDRSTGGPGMSSAPLLVSPSPPFVPSDEIGADELPLFERPPLLASPEEKYVPDQVIVKFKDRIQDSDVQQLNQALGTEVIYASPYAGFKVLQIPDDKIVAEMVDIYSRQSIVEYAEPNYIDHITWSPNDTLYSYQWHFDQINLESAWGLDTTAPNYGGDPSVVVAVIDTGVSYETYGAYVQAPDLANTNFTTGYDFVNDDAHPNDDNSHGTHVCGTIAQSTNNGEGVAGIAFCTTIMPVKVLDANGSGTHAQMADGFYYAANNGAHIINYSAGGSHSTTKENAAAYAYNHGVTIICAAGNDYETGNDAEYPAAYDEYCIAVGAVRYDQTHSYYSNTGPYLDIAAPGGDVTVDQNSDGYADGVLQQTFAEGDPTDFAYYFFQGTSMACPHVAGVAALILAGNPSLTPDQVRQILESTATDLGDPGRDDVYGWGLLNASTAVAAAVDCPWLSESPDSGSVPAPGSTDITVTFDTTGLGSDYTAEIVVASNDPDENPVMIPVTLHVVASDPPAVNTDAATLVEETTATLNGTLTDDGGVACEYRFQYDTDSGAPYAHSTSWTGSKTCGQSFDQAISGLSEGTKYYFRAQAKNSAGTASGAEQSFLTKPDAPASFDARSAGDTQIDLTWTKGEGAQRTKIQRKEGDYPADKNDGETVYFDTGESCSDMGLMQGARYYYRAWSEVTGSTQWSNEYAQDTTIAGLEGATISGVTREANCEILTVVTIELYEGAVPEGDPIDTVDSDGSGNYEIIAPETGWYSLVAKKATFRDEIQVIEIVDIEVGYLQDFTGDTSLVPDGPNMTYVLVCVNHWLGPQEDECHMEMTKVLAVVNAWLD